jgi:hypothetical protein
MVKIGGRDITVDQGINIAFGAGAVIDGVVGMISPGKVQVSFSGPLAHVRVCGISVQAATPWTLLQPAIWLCMSACPQRIVGSC